MSSFYPQRHQPYRLDFKLPGAPELRGMGIRRAGQAAHLNPGVNHPDTGSEIYVSPCFSIFAQVSLNGTDRLNTIFPADESVSTQK